MKKPACAFKRDALKLATLQYLWLWHFFRVLWNIKIFTIDFCYNQTIGTWHHFFSTLQHAIERLKLFSLFHKTNCFQIFVLYLRFVGTILISFQTKRFKYFILCCKCIGCLACLYSKMPLFQMVGLREGGKSLPLAFLMIWRPCDLNSVMISSMASKCQHCKVGMPPFYVLLPS